MDLPAAYEPNLISALAEIHSQHPAIVCLSLEGVADLLHLLGGFDAIPDILEVTEAFRILGIEPCSGWVDEDLEKGAEHG